MGLESSTTIQGLNIAWPLGTDPRSEGDNHLRLVKTVLKNVFDDSNANVLLFKVALSRFSKTATTQHFEAMQGSTLRGQLAFNFGAGVAPMARLRAYTDTGSIANTLTLDDTGLTLSVGVLSVQTLSVSGGITTAGVLSGRELVVDPTSAVTGIHIKASDANSGRLFFETATTPIKWSISAWDADGTLRFNSGGTYGSATGTSRMHFYENGTGDFGNLLRARYAFQITRDGIDSAARGTIGVSPAFNLYMQRYGADGSTVEGSLVLAGGAVLEYSPQAGATTARFDLNDNPGTPRVSLYWDATNGAVIYARDAANARIGYVTLKPDGRLLHGGPSTEAEVIDTGNLNLTTYTGSNNTNTSYPVGSIISMYTNDVVVARNALATPCLGNPDTQYFRLSGQPNAGTALPGTWRARGHIDSNWVLMQKVAN